MIRRIHLQCLSELTMKIIQNVSKQLVVLQTYNTLKYSLYKSTLLLPFPSFGNLNIALPRCLLSLISNGDFATGMMLFMGSWFALTGTYSFALIWTKWSYSPALPFKSVNCWCMKIDKEIFVIIFLFISLNHIYLQEFNTCFVTG